MRTWRGMAITLSFLTVTITLGVPGCGRARTSIVVERVDVPVMLSGVAGRAITQENPTGAPGEGGKAGGGRKGAPCIKGLPNGETAVLMDYAGRGVIRHIWITVDDRSPETLRNLILRMYWDGSPVPSVEVPLGDFFGTAHGRAVPLVSCYVTATLGRGFNCYFPMPFESHARVTIENDLPDGEQVKYLFYQIDFEARDHLPLRAGRFHAQFRRQNPTALAADYVILDDVVGPGMFIGCVVGVRPMEGDWWGEGEFKFYLDGDWQYPTICGTGTEDYFGAAWGMDLYQTPWHGCTVHLKDDPAFPHGLVSMYRFHEKDPVYFQEKLKLTAQQLGWRAGEPYFERRDDWCSVAYWYQLKPNPRMPELPDRAARSADIVGTR